MATRAHRDHEKLAAFVEQIGDGPGPPGGRFDLITSFDVVHASVDPIGLMGAIRGALGEDGTYLMLEMNAPSDEEKHPLGGLIYEVSKLYRMATSLSHGGAGSGPRKGEERARELAYAAGFTRFRKLPIGNPFSVLYELKA